MVSMSRMCWKRKGFIRSSYAQTNTARSRIRNPSGEFHLLTKCFVSVSFTITPRSNLWPTSCCFPSFAPRVIGRPLGGVFYGDWIKVQNAAVPNAAEERKVFHSFRKTGGADLKDAGVASELRADILGHGGDNLSEERYVSSAKLKQMFDALQKLPIVTTHLEPGEICLSERPSQRCS